MSQPPHPEHGNSHQYAPHWNPQSGPHQPYAQGYPHQHPPHPKKSNKTLFIVLGSIATLLALVFIAVLVFTQSLASKEKETIAKMESIASRIIPGDDWVEKLHRSPKVDPACLPIDVSCHRLQKSWETGSNVSLSDLESQLGVELKDTNWKGCHLGEEEGIEVELCISDDDTPQVNLLLED